MELENLIAQETVFTVNGIPVESMDCFKYLGHIVTVDDSDAPAVMSNLCKACGCWAQVSCILTCEGATPKVSAMFYKAVMQSVLLFSCEMWVESDAIARSLDGFHHYIARKLSGRWICRRVDGNGWIYPVVGPALADAGMFTMATYFSRRRDYLLAWAKTDPIMTSTAH